MVAPRQPVDNPSAPTTPTPALAPHEPVESVVRRLIAADTAMLALPAARACTGAADPADDDAVAVGGSDVDYLPALRPGAAAPQRGSLNTELEVPTVLSVVQERPMHVLLRHLASPLVAAARRPARAVRHRELDEPNQVGAAVAVAAREPARLPPFVKADDAAVPSSGTSGAGVPIHDGRYGEMAVKT
ncbi:hypothetical protein DL764_011008 [Monosporascus ibericus]|uniref:Uncharacterized protein n=1 Tax=Monosporascus ibericus TaxID=155417 RepID=A0A4Q4SRN7_9PEZI|nr:hypothetical protein DL764_011008 [Monosporascus ibericus]